MRECLKGIAIDWGKIKNIQKEKRHSHVKTVQPSCSPSTYFVFKTLAIILCSAYSALSLPNYGYWNSRFGYESSSPCQWVGRYLRKIGVTPQSYLRLKQPLPGQNLVAYSHLSQGRPGIIDFSRTAFWSANTLEFFLLIKERKNKYPRQLVISPTILLLIQLTWHTTGWLFLLKYKLISSCIFSKKFQWSSISCWI